MRRRQLARDHHIRRFAAAPVQNVLGAQLQPRQHELRIDAAFKAITRIGNDALLAARARDARRIEPGGFDEDVDGAVKAAALHAAHHAGNAQRLGIIGDHNGVAVERVGLFVQRQNTLAVFRHAGAQPAGQLVGVEHVQRAAAILRNKIGGIDQRRDRLHADALQLVLHPFGCRAILDAADQPSGEDRSSVLCFGREIQRDSLGARIFARHRLHFFRFQLAQTASGQIAGDAEHAGRVAAIGRDRHIEQGIVGQEARGFERARHRLTGLGIGLELDDAVMVFAQQQFAGAAHHAARFHIADLADLQRFAGRRNHRAGTGQHHLDAGARVGCAAHDLQRLLAVTDRAQAQLVGIGMLVGGQHFAHHESLQGGAGIGDAFDFQSDAGKLFADDFRRRVGVEMLFQPAQGELHFESPPSSVGMSSGWKP